MLFSEGLGFWIEGAEYALDNDAIEKILDVPKITPLPFCDPRVAGIATIEGDVVTVIDMHRVLSRGVDAIDAPQQGSKILVVAVAGSSYALIADGVSGAFRIRSEEVKCIKDEGSRTFLIGILQEEEKAIGLLDLDTLINTLRTESAPKKEIQEPRTVAKKGEVSEQKEGYLFFMLGGETYGVKSDILKEVVRYPQNITKIEISAQAVFEMMVLRKETVAIVDCARLFDKQTVLTEESRVIILEYEGRNVGFLVDKVTDIKEIPMDAIEDFPDNFHADKLKGVYRDAKYFASIVSEEFFCAYASKVSTLAYSLRADTKEVTEINSSQKEFALFEIFGQEYGINTEGIREVLSYHPPKPIPFVTNKIAGIINVRGEVIPVLALFESFGDTKQEDEQAKIAVCEFEGERVGIVVHSAREMVRVDENDVKEVRGDSKIEGVILLEKGMRNVPILCLEKILKDVKGAIRG